MIQERALPNALYKYTSTENAMLTITGKALWFSSPRQFNDPFDCNANLLDFTPSTSMIKTIINDKVAGSRAVRRREMVKNRKSPHRIVNQASEQVQDLFYQSGVCCFSAVSQNILMWAHYAGNHSGVCLGFDAGVNEIADIAAWVNYQTRFSKVNFWDGKADVIAHLLLSKAHDWHYEQEIRLIRTRNNGKCAFDPGMLREVVFGLKTSPQHIEDIKSAVQAGGYSNVVFKKATMDKNSFSLVIR